MVSEHVDMSRRHAGPVRNATTCHAPSARARNTHNARGPCGETLLPCGTRCRGSSGEGELGGHLSVAAQEPPVALLVDWLVATGAAHEHSRRRVAVPSNASANDLRDGGHEHCDGREVSGEVGLQGKREEAQTEAPDVVQEVDGIESANAEAHRHIGAEVPRLQRASSVVAHHEDYHADDTAAHIARQDAECNH